VLLPSSIVQISVTGYGIGRCYLFAGRVAGTGSSEERIREFFSGLFFCGCHRDDDMIVERPGEGKVAKITRAIDGKSTNRRLGGIDGRMEPMNTVLLVGEIS